MRAALVVSGLCLISGCYKLDPFLYSPKRTDAYVFTPESSDPLKAVTADRIEPLNVRVNDAVSLGAVYVRAAVQPPKGYLLFFHGQGDHIGTSAQFGRVKRLSNLGYDVLAFDYRGFGTSTAVTVTEAGVKEDAAAARAVLVARAAGSPRIIYYGHSFGTAVATQASAEAAPALLVLESPFASIDEMKRDSSQMDFPVEFIASDNWDTAGRIADVHAPLLILHGTADDYVRPEFSALIYERANEPKQRELIEGAQHDVAEFLGARFPPLVNDFVDRYLP